MGGSSDSGNSAFVEATRFAAETAASPLGPLASFLAGEVGERVAEAAETYVGNNINSGIHPDYGNYTAMGDYGGQQGQHND
ncbi:hypothetical protein ASD54_01630 [Rhizobium sp. Root149]|nr:hypothetical protein ASD54_01630 [Rhizobium sp. Root149]